MKDLKCFQMSRRRVLRVLVAATVGAASVAVLAAQRQTLRAESNRLTWSECPDSPDLVIMDGWILRRSDIGQSNVA